MERKLVIVVDIDTVDWNPEAIDPEGLLAGLSHDEAVIVYKFSDNGAPPSSETMTTEWWPPAAIGWLVANNDPDDPMLSHSLVLCDGDTLTHAALFREMVSTLARSVPEVDAVVALAASEIKADILVTARPALLAHNPLGFVEALTVASPKEAVPIVGLYLRSNGKYLPTKSENFTLSYNKGLYWGEAARLQVPSLLNLGAMASALDQDRGTDNLGPLAFAAHRRIARALERRDSVWRLIDQPQDVDVADDMRAAVESILTYLMGAGDALANVTEQVLQLHTGNPSWIGWQKDRWLRTVRKSSPALGAVFSNGSNSSTVLEILRSLRNLIHAQGLDSVTSQHSNRETTTRLLLALDDQSDLIQLMKNVGSDGRWGRRDDYLRYASYDFGALTDTLTLEMLKVLASVAAGIEELLLTSGVGVPPRTDTVLNQALIDEHMNWQLGLAI